MPQIVIYVIATALIILCVMGYVLIAEKNKKPQTQLTPTAPMPTIKMLNRDGDPEDDEWHTYIAGINYRASKYDIGGFSGWVGPDPDNAYDPNAMGVYNAFGKLLGYIPAKELKEYRKWCGAQPQPCVGFIYEEDGEKRGRVKILRPCNTEFLETEFSRYLQWVNDNYGKEYLPKTMSMQFDTES